MTWTIEELARVVCRELWRLIIRCLLPSRCDRVTTQGALERLYNQHRPSEVQLDLHGSLLAWSWL